MDNGSHMKMQKFSIFGKKKLKIGMLKKKDIAKVGAIVIVQVKKEMLQIAYVTVPKEILTAFYYGSTYDYPFIIEEVAEEIEGQLDNAKLIDVVMTIYNLIAYMIE